MAFIFPDILGIIIPIDFQPSRKKWWLNTCKSLGSFVASHLMTQQKNIDSPVDWDDWAKIQRPGSIETQNRWKWGGEKVDSLAISCYVSITSGIPLEQDMDSASFWTPTKCMTPGRLDQNLSVADDFTICKVGLTNIQKKQNKQQLTDSCIEIWYDIAI